MTSLQDINMQEALSHSSFGNPSGGVSSHTQAMLMMQKALAAGGNNAAFPGSIPPTSSFPPLPGKDMLAAAAAASLGGSTQASLMTQYYQNLQKLWGAALNNGHGSPNNSQLPSALHGGPPPHIPLPPSLPASMPTSSTSTNMLMSSSALSSPSSTSSVLTSQASSQLEPFHHNSNSQGRLIIYNN